LRSADAACARLGAEALRAVVLAGNTASKRCFNAAGFSETGQAALHGRDCAIFERRCP